LVSSEQHLVFFVALSQPQSKSLLIQSLKIRNPRSTGEPTPGTLSGSESVSISKISALAIDDVFLFDFVELIVESVDLSEVVTNFLSEF
jgi:hypothetical protein